MTSIENRAERDRADPEHIPARPLDLREPVRRTTASPVPRGPAPARALPPRRRSGRARGARRALPAARPPARPSLPARRRAARRPDPGRLARPAEGDRPLRPRSRETAFSSFAVPTILGELKRHFRDKGWSVRVPRDLQELAVKVDRVSEDMARELGRAPTPAEIAERDRHRPPSRCSRRARPPAPTARCRSTARATTTRTSEGELADAFGIEDPGFAARRGRRHRRAADARADRRASARCCACASPRT